MLPHTSPIKGVELLTKGLDKLIVTNEELKESLEESKSSFESATDELESLESELKTTTDRLEELQKLADNNTVFVDLSKLDMIGKLDANFHPNAKGMKAIADEVLKCWK